MKQIQMTPDASFGLEVRILFFLVFFYILTNLHAINTQPPGREMAQEMGNEGGGSKCAPGNICTCLPPTYTSTALTQFNIGLLQLTPNT